MNNETWWCVNAKSSIYSRTNGTHPLTFGFFPCTCPITTRRKLSLRKNEVGWFHSLRVILSQPIHRLLCSLRVLSKSPNDGWMRGKDRSRGRRHTRMILSASSMDREGRRQSTDWQECWIIDPQFRSNAIRPHSFTVTSVGQETVNKDHGLKCDRMAFEDFLGYSCQRITQPLERYSRVWILDTDL